MLSKESPTTIYMLPFLIIAVLLTYSLTAAQQVGTRQSFAVTVLDGSGQAVTGLSREQFRGTLGGKQTTIRFAAPYKAPCRVILLVDGGLEMFFGHTWEKATLVAKEAASALAPEHSVRVAAFGESLVLYGGFTRDANQVQSMLAQALRNAEEKHVSRTSLLDPIRLSVAAIADPQPEDVLLVVANSRIWRDPFREREVAQTLERQIVPSGVRVAVVWVDDLLAVGSASAVEEIRKLTSTTGGHWMYVRGTESPAEMRARLKYAMEVITQTYRVEVEFPEAVDRPREWKLEILDEKGKPRKDIRITYRRLLVPAEVRQGS